MGTSVRQDAERQWYYPHEYAEAEVEAVSDIADEDGFAGRWPDATDRLLCAEGTVLRKGDVVKWVDEADDGNTTMYALVLAPRDVRTRNGREAVPLQLAKMEGTARPVGPVTDCCKACGAVA